jgi:hypothetical protein
MLSDQLTYPGWSVCLTLIILAQKTLWLSLTSRLEGLDIASVPQVLCCAKVQRAPAKEEELHTGEGALFLAITCNKLGQTRLAPSTLWNNEPFSLEERDESETPGPFQWPRRLPAGQPVSNNQLVGAPQVDLSKSRHLSLQVLDGACLHGKWSYFTFRGIVPSQETNFISLKLASFDFPDGKWCEIICKEKWTTQGRMSFCLFKAHQSARLISNIGFGY